jgi:hypothetical protein
MTSIASTVDNRINNSLDGKVDLLTEMMVRTTQATGLGGVLLGLSEAFTYGLDTTSAIIASVGAAVIAGAEAYRHWYANLPGITYADTPVKRSNITLERMAVPSKPTRRSAYGNNPSHADMVSAYGGKSYARPVSNVQQYSPASAAAKRRANTRAATGFSYADLIGGSKQEVAEPVRAKPSLLAAVDSYAKQKEADAAYQDVKEEAERHAYSMNAMCNYPTKAEPNVEMYDPSLEAEMAALTKQITRAEPKVTAVVPGDGLGERIAAVENTGIHRIPAILLASQPRLPKYIQRQQQSPAA